MFDKFSRMAAYTSFFTFLFSNFKKMFLKTSFYSSINAKNVHVFEMFFFNKNLFMPPYKEFYSSTTYKTIPSQQLFLENYEGGIVFLANMVLYC